MTQTFFEVFFNFAHCVFASSTSSIFFDIHSSRHLVFYESIANLNMLFSSSFSMFTYQRDQRLRQFAIAHSQKESLIASMSF